MSESFERPAQNALRRVLPFLIAALLVTWVLARLEFRAFFSALATTNYLGYVAFAIAYIPLLLSTDVFATTHVYAKAICPIRYRELWVIRGASYLPSLLNHHVGQGWLTYFVARTYGASLWRVAGATLIVYTTIFGNVFLLALAALGAELVLGRERVPWLAPAVGLVSLGALGYALLLLFQPRILQRRQTTAPLMEFGLGGHLLALIVRLPHVLVQFVGTWLPFWFFGVKVPLVDALVLVPVIMLVVVLPITPQGIGMRDVTALGLLLRFAPGDAAQRTAAVAAATLSWAVMITLVELALSLALMPRAHELLRSGQATQSG